MQYAAGDAAVEQHRQGDVGAGAGVHPEQLDHDGADRGDDDRRDDRRDAGEQAERDAGQGDVAEAVTQKGESALHQERADRRCSEPGEHRRDQRAAHELVVEELVHQITPSPGTPGWRSGCAWWWTCAWSSCTTPSTGPVVRDCARFEHDGAVDQLAQRAELVGHQEDRRSFQHESVQEVGKYLLVLVVDPGGGLVHDQQLGLGGQCAGDEGALLHSARELAECRSAAVGKADSGDRGSDGSGVLGGAPADVRAVGESPARDHLSYGRGNSGDRARTLGHVAEAAALREVSQGSAEQLDRAGGHRHQPDRRAYERRLARAVGAEQGDELTGSRPRGRPVAGQVDHRSRR